MQYSSLVAALALAGSAFAQSSNMSICDKYTTALLKNNTAANQLTLLTLLVNTAVIGNYTKPTIPGITFPNVKVAGILANGTVNGTQVNLLPYFNGGLASSNRGGSAGVAVNFLDDGGAAPLMNNMPANGTSSNQYKLLTHLYQFFGVLLGCSQQGMTGYSSYQGQASQYSVHKYMDLNYAQVSYFNQQVALAAASFGVSQDDINTVGMALNNYFNVRCEPAVTLAPALGSQLQSICIADSCPLAPNNTCSAYAAAVQPGVANSTLAMGQGNSSSPATSSAAAGGSSTASASSSGGAAATSSVHAAGAGQVAGSGLAGLAGLLAFLL